MHQLPSARGDRTLHFKNLNRYQTDGYPAAQMDGKFWEIDEAIYDEFLEMLPPRYCTGGFRMIEELTDNLAATFQKVGGRYWCSYVVPQDVTRIYNHISRLP
ncbi:DUF1419 domain-containing protein [Rhizobium sp. Leaf383]|uniref:DUF1419 domain-containing protein n=1 Tax=Rhizobium sp. Leaf383 TaxID=1736357 RepID=UPI0007123A8C|nr:DUF1419 domain-containing protein [Rhizobium sp. Leaf383]KQS84283.1 hypothetical protein ASG58_21165 [Rhizobium sp. Leaf383]